MATSFPLLRVGMAGLGTVGAAVWQRVQSQGDLLRQRTGTEIRIEQIAVRRAERAKAIGVPLTLTTADWHELVTNPNLDVIIELIGGTTDAFTLIQTALQNGKHVITANKALLAERGAELFALAAQHQRHLLFEASVAGGIPILRALREGLVANHIHSLYGIINGTCNYILTRMNESGLEFRDALAEAKAGGYAEADDSLDVDGFDTAHKAAVLAALAYGLWIPAADLYTEGLRQLDKQDLIYARKLGYELKLLAMIKNDLVGEIGAVEVRVHPTLIPAKHPLAAVSGVYNAVLVRGDVVGDTLYYGRGAGGDPTASSVLSDLAQIACQPKVHATASGQKLYTRVKKMDEIISRYYLRLRVEDRPGVLAEIARLLAARQIGISSVIQPEVHAGETASLVLMLHDAPEQQFRAVVAEIGQCRAVKANPVYLRVEDFEG